MPSASLLFSALAFLRIDSSLFYNDNECIKILQDNDNFYKTVKQKLCNELYGNIDEKEYNNFYNKLLQIKKSSIISYNYLDSGNKINTIDL